MVTINGNRFVYVSSIFVVTKKLVIPSWRVYSSNTFKGLRAIHVCPTVQLNLTRNTGRSKALPAERVLTFPARTTLGRKVRGSEASLSGKGASRSSNTVAPRDFVLQPISEWTSSRFHQFPFSFSPPRQSLWCVYTNPQYFEYSITSLLRSNRDQSSSDSRTVQ